MTPHINRYNIVRQQILVCHRSIVYSRDFISFFFFYFGSNNRQGTSRISSHQCAIEMKSIQYGKVIAFLFAVTFPRFILNKANIILKRKTKVIYGDLIYICVNGVLDR